MGLVRDGISAESSNPFGRLPFAVSYRDGVTPKGALAFLVGAIWLGAIVALLAWITGHAQRRRHGGRPLHLIPWYRGGEVERPFEAPPEESRAKHRSGR
jgi:hypothetical protein